MLEVVLIDMLRKKGILTDEETGKILTLYDLYNQLVMIGEVDRISDIDLKVLEDIEKLKKSRKSLDDKLVFLRRFSLKAENKVLKKLIVKTIEKINKVKEKH